MSGPSSRSEKRAATSKADALLFLTAAALLPSGTEAAAAVFRLEAFPGEARYYGVTLASEAEFVGAPGTSQTSAMRVSLSGAAEYGVGPSDGGATLVRLLIESPILKGDVQGQPLDAATIEKTQKGLARGVYLNVANDGTVVGFDAEPGLDPLALQLLRQLAGCVQARLPQGGETSYTVLEIDAAGQYEARYDLAARRDAFLPFTKAKSGYTQVFVSGAGGADALKSTVEGAFKGSINAVDGWPWEVDGKESTVSYLAGRSDPVSRGTTACRASFQRRAKLGDDVVQELSRRKMPEVGGRALGIEPGADAKREAALRQLNGRSLADLEQRAREAAAEKGKKEQSNLWIAVGNEIAAWMYLHEDDLSELEARIKGRDVTDEFYFRVLSAAGAQGCPKCQALLRRELEARAQAKDHDSTFVATANLSAPAIPEAASVKLLRKIRGKGLLGKYENTVDYAIGAIALQLKAADPQRAEEIVKEYEKRLANTKDQYKYEVVIETLGNTGSERLPDILKKALADKREEVRALAVFALRFPTGQKAIAAAVTALSDPSERVRESAVEALAPRQKAFENALPLIEALRKEPSATVRRALVTALGSVADRSVPALEAVRERLKDPDETVRSHAATMLNGMPKGPALMP